MRRIIQHRVGIVVDIDMESVAEVDPPDDPPSQSLKTLHLGKRKREQSLPWREKIIGELGSSIVGMKRWLDSNEMGHANMDMSDGRWLRSVLSDMETHFTR